MNRLATILLLTVTVVFAGCSTPEVKYSDLRPPTRATISGQTITVHLGSDLTNSACFTRPQVRVERGTVLIAGYRTLEKQDRDLGVRLPPSVNSQSVTVVWIDPDGSRISVPIAK